MTPYYEDTKAGIVIYHGDCREVLPSITSPVSLVLTDPPYGKSLRNHDRAGHRSDRSFDIANDDSQKAGIEAIEFVRGNKWPIAVFADPMRPWPGEWRQHLVWDKGPAVGGGGDPFRLWKQTWELIQFFGTGELSGRRDSAVLKYWVVPADSILHPAAKPVSLLAYLIHKMTKQGELVLDPFVGSGSTTRAAKDTGRSAIGIEIEERYCEIAANRLRQEVLF